MRATGSERHHRRRGCAPGTDSRLVPVRGHLGTNRSVGWHGDPGGRAGHVVRKPGRRRNTARRHHDSRRSRDQLRRRISRHGLGRRHRDLGPGRCRRRRRLLDGGRRRVRGRRRHVLSRFVELSTTWSVLVECRRAGQSGGRIRAGIARPMRTRRRVLLDRGARIVDQSSRSATTRRRARSSGRICRGGLGTAAVGTLRQSKNHRGLRDS